MIRSKTKYGIVLGLSTNIYPINNTFKPINIDTDVIGSAIIAVISTNMNFLKYFNG